MKFSFRQMYLVIIVLLALPHPGNSQDKWTKLADYEGCFTHSQIVFAIDDFIYVGLGADWCIEMWEYSLLNDTWTQKADFPGSGVSDRPIAFSIDDKGYVCQGGDDSGVHSKEVWEYDPTNDEWTRKSDFPGIPRGVPNGFTIDGKFYLTQGVTVNNGISEALNDLWVYDPKLDAWNELEPSPKTISGGVAFAAGGFGFVGMGQDEMENEFTSAFMRYDPRIDKWTEVASIPREPTVLATGFSIGNRGYVGMGLDSSRLFFEYDPTKDLWTRRIDYPDVKAYDEGIGVGVNGIGYMGLGDDVTGEFFNNYSFYSYTPDNSVNVVDQSPAASSNLVIYPNPAPPNSVLQLNIDLQFFKHPKVEIFDQTGKIVLQRQNLNMTLHNPSSAGNYLIRITDSEAVNLFRLTVIE